MKFKTELWLGWHMFLDLVDWFISLTDSLFPIRAFKCGRFCRKHGDSDWSVLMLLAFTGLGGLIMFIISIWATYLQVDWRGPVMCILSLFCYELGNFHFKGLIKEKQEKYDNCAF
jgi:hypothetical protein